MSLAFSALLLFLLISPGIAFRFAFLKNDALQVTVDTSLVSELLLMVFPALFLHGIGDLVLYNLPHWQINYPFLLELILGKDTHAETWLNRSALYGFAIYLGLINLVGYLAGHGFQQLVLHFRLDQWSRLFKPYNQWDHLLGGWTLPNRDRISFIQLDLLVATADGEVIYCGILEKYFLNKDRQLDRLHLINVYRRPLNKDADPFERTDEKEEIDNDLDEFEHYLTKFDARYYSLPGDSFVVPFAQVKNMNITYCTKQKVSTAPAVF